MPEITPFEPDLDNSSVGKRLIDAIQPAAPPAQTHSMDRR